MSLRIRTGVCETIFQYKGESPELWTKVLTRIVKADAKHKHGYVAVVNVEGLEDAVTSNGLRQLKHCVKDCAFIVDVERMLSILEQGWKDFKLDFERYDFKRGVKALWKAFCASPSAGLEPEIVEALRENVFAHTVEGLTAKLWTRGNPAKFASVRDALIHLDKLGLVDYENGEYSIRESLL